MKNPVGIMGALVLTCLISCNGNGVDETTDLTSDTLETTLEIDSVDKNWFPVEADSLFRIELPVNMTENLDLNDDASLQYSYIKKVSGVVKEHYVIVMTDTKEEIESYNLAVEFDAMSFSQAALESVVEGYDTYEILTTEPVVETINKMDCVIYEIEAALGDVHTYHMLAVFDGKKAFYQILTWTISDQQEEFKSGMEHMIQSFSEL